jgi:hypothetical protein
MKIKNIAASVLLTCVVMSAVSLRAQPNAPTAVQQMQNFQQNMEQQKPLRSLKAGTNAPEMYAGENSDIGPQHILRLLPQRTLFEVDLDSQYLYTDNAMLTARPVRSSTELVNTIRAAFSPTPYKMGNGRFAPSIGYLSQWYDYGLGGDDLSVMDFNVQTAFASAKYLFPNDWSVFGEFDYTRLSSQQLINHFYSDYTPILGVQRLIQVGNNGLISASLQADYHDSWTINSPNNSQDRADGIFGLAFAWQFTPHLMVQPSYRFQYTYYRFNTLHQSGRNDYLNRFGITAAYYFTPKLSLRVFANDDIKETGDALAQKYHDYNFGVALSYTIRF